MASLFANAKICCADDYFMKEGEYNWDREKLGRAHEWCFNKAQEYCIDEFSTIVIANTNTSPKEFAPYVALGEAYGYRIHHVIIENRHGGENEHGVPEEALVKMEQKIKSTLKLR